MSLSSHGVQAVFLYFTNKQLSATSSVTPIDKPTKNRQDVRNLATTHTSRLQEARGLAIPDLATLRIGGTKST